MMKTEEEKKARHELLVFLAKDWKARGYTLKEIAEDLEITQKEVKELLKEK